MVVLKGKQLMFFRDTNSVKKISNPKSFKFSYNHMAYIIMQIAVPKINLFNNITPFGRKIIWPPYMPMILRTVIDKLNFPYIV
jgi:hypothetical protein